MHKLYNPDDREFLLFVGGVEIQIPPKSFIVKDLDERTVRDLKESAPAIEVVEVSTEDIHPPKPPKAEKPGKGKKGAKK